MGTQQQARALMMRHHHTLKNRQMSLLNRSAAEIGLASSKLDQGRGKHLRQP